MNAPIFELKTIRTGYGDVEVLHSISVAFNNNEITAIIGSNGAGKSTLIKCGIGLLPVWKGSVYIDGVDVTSEPVHLRVARGIGYVPQGRVVVPNMTVKENLELGGFLIAKKGGNIKDVMEKVLNMFPRLKERLMQKAGTMSGGEQQMVALGRALMQEPRAIILDEPSLGLSPQLVEIVFDDLRRLSTNGIGIIVVEQKASRALMLADVGIVMHLGEIYARGAAEDLLENEEVRKLFLGIPRQIEITQG